MENRRMKPAVKFSFIFLAVMVIMGVIWGIAHSSYGKKVVASNGAASSESSSSGFHVPFFGGDSKADINVCVNVWGGYAGVLYENGGMKPNAESLFAKNYGIKANLILIDDFENSRSAWKAGKCDLLWNTTGAFTTEVTNLAAYNPKITHYYDFSYGGDVMVGTFEVKSLNDLRGKSVAFAEGSPSEEVLLAALNSAGLAYDQIKMIKTKSAPDAAAAFKAGKADAAVMWSPDDKECLKAIARSHVLLSTKQASNLVADIMFGKQEWLEAHKDVVTKFVSGWLAGNAEVKSSNAALQSAAKVMADGFNVKVEDARDMIGNARLATYGDNLNFFGLSDTPSGVTGDEIYTRSGVQFEKVGLASNVPAWRSVTDTSILRAVNMQPTGINAPEGRQTFSRPTEQIAAAPALSTKPLTVNFTTGSSTLDENAKNIIDKEFLAIAKGFKDVRVRVEGNTDNAGNAASNKALSERRAKSVVDYLVSAHGFDRNRFVPKGNGDGNPVADNNTEEGKAKNRRTDFELINEAQL